MKQWLATVAIMLMGTLQPIKAQESAEFPQPAPYYETEGPHEEPPESYFTPEEQEAEAAETIVSAEEAQLYCEISAVSWQVAVAMVSPADEETLELAATEMSSYPEITLRAEEYWLAYLLARDAEVGASLEAALVENDAYDCLESAELAFSEGLWLDASGWAFDAVAYFSDAASLYEEATAHGLEASSIMQGAKNELGF